MGLPYTVAWMGEFILLVHMYYKHTYMYFRYSRKIIWLDVLTTNNDPSVILHSYLLAVQVFYVLFAIESISNCSA